MICSQKIVRKIYKSGNKLFKWNLNFFKILYFKKIIKIW